MARDNNDHMQIVQQFFDSITNANASLMLQLVTDDLVWVVPKSAVSPYGGTHHGAKHIIKMMLDAAGGTFIPGSVRHHILSSISENDAVAVETNMKAQQANGRQYDNYYVFIFVFNNGLIKEIREHVDTAYAADFFGSS